MSTARQGMACALVAAAIGVCAAGCGTPGAPQPPSLNLPDRVTDLAAVRAGGQVTLTWTMPRRNTDKIALKGDIPVHVCRIEVGTTCVPAGEKSFAPGASASFTDVLPAALASGAPRPVSYFVELKNRNGRSAGLSHPAVVLAGEAPAAVTGLSIEVRKQGIVLRWNAVDQRDAIRLHRTLLNPPPAKPKQGPLAAPVETVNRDLLVDHDAGVALDKDIRFGQSYEYRAQRIARVEVEGKTVELAGELSAPIRVQAQDIFPPAVPTGLAAVATGATAEGPASIDLSWQASAETDTAGYFVYRREQQTPWRRISGEQPVVGPAFHDTDVLPGHTYTYAVSAADARGNESGRSAEASDTVPKPAQ
jgi:hypothetical protein